MKLLICNWKENKTLKEALAYKQKIESASFHMKLVICPSYPLLPVMHSKKYAIGAQDVSRYEKGNFTGEVSAETLKSIDVKYVIIGHFERELYFLENNQVIQEKIQNALKANLKVILPIGENKMEYQLGKTKQVLEEKLESLLLNIPKEYQKNIAIAYEPAWRVGKETKINKKEIMDTILFIKKWLYDHEYPNNPVLFGGGLTTENVKSLSEVDGFLLGTMSQNVEKVLEIMQFC